MKQRFKFLLSVVAVSALLLPGLFTAVSAKTVGAFSASQAPAEAAVVQPAVTMVKLASTAKVSLSSGSTCNVKNESTNNLVQDAGALNLNQPASCFSLSLGVAVSAGINLAVKPLAGTLPKILVSYNQPTVAFPNLATAPVSQTMPILPAASVAIFVGVLAFERKLKFRQLSSSNPVGKFSFDIYRLGVMRC